MWNKFVKGFMENKAQVFLWVLTLLTLLLFVVLAIAIDKGTDTYANILAAVGAVFGALLTGSLFTTAIMSYIKSKRGGTND